MVLATHHPLTAFFTGAATALGAGVSMAFSGDWPCAATSPMMAARRWRPIAAAELRGRHLPPLPFPRGAPLDGPVPDGPLPASKTASPQLGDELFARLVAYGTPHETARVTCCSSRVTWTST